MRQDIEVVGSDMMCFKVDARTLEPRSCSYYQPAAWRDPQGPQMSLSEWQRHRAAQRDAALGRGGGTFSGTLRGDTFSGSLYAASRNPLILRWVGWLPDLGSNQGPTD